RGDPVIIPKTVSVTGKSIRLYDILKILEASPSTLESSSPPEALRRLAAKVEKEIAYYEALRDKQGQDDEGNLIDLDREQPKLYSYNELIVHTIEAQTNKLRMVKAEIDAELGKATEEAGR
ncbi:MAG: hypothetical protein KGI38_12750, partial [Thaumarchaeota archaeon]|nr:hypothetical protein [Nitrososphaerota archaeon]